MSELMLHLDAWHTNRLGYLKEQRTKIRTQAYQEQTVEEFWKNKGRLEILNTLINIEMSLQVRDDEPTGIEVTHGHPV